MERVKDTRWLQKERNGTNIQTKRSCYGVRKLSRNKAEGTNNEGPDESG